MSAGIGVEVVATIGGLDVLASSVVVGRILCWPPKDMVVKKRIPHKESEGNHKIKGKNK